MARRSRRSPNVALLSILVVAILRAVLNHEQVTIQTIVGAIAAYALIGMAFSWLFLGMDDRRQRPSSRWRHGPVRLSRNSASSC